MTKPVVVGIGELLWDCFENAPPRLGGAPANVAFHASQLGMEGIVVSRVGSDPNGERAVSVLQSHHMTPTFLQHDDACPTGTVDVALSPSGQPTYTIHENVAWDFIAWNAELAFLAIRTSAVVWGSLAQRSPVGRDTIRRFVHAVPASAIRLFDINLRQHFYTTELLRESLTSASVVKLNDEELTTLSRLLDLPPHRADAIARLITDFDLILVALTLGANGAELYPANAPVVHIAGQSVSVVDAVGAGDAFTAALLVGLLRGDQSLQEIGRRANQIGGYVAGQSGAMPILPAEWRTEGAAAV